MEKIKNHQEKELNKEEKRQIIEGLIVENWQKKLPPGITEDMVEQFLGNDGLWRWHLKPEFIKDEKEREQYKAERGQWLSEPGE